MSERIRPSPLSRQIWEAPAVVFVVTFVVYDLAFLHLALPTYEHHDSYATLGLRPNCSGFDWYGVWTGRPLHAFALCWATMLGEGHALAREFRIAACLSTAAAAGLFAVVLSRCVRRGMAVLFALTAFSLPGVLLAVTLFQATFFAFCCPFLVATGIASILLFRAPPPRVRLLLVSAAQFLVILGVLELYQAMAPLIFLPVLTMVFFDRRRFGSAALAPVIHLTILFALASVSYLVGVRIIHAVVAFPPTVAVDSRNIDVSLGPSRLIDAIRWVWSVQIAQVSRLWFINDPQALRYALPITLSIVALGTCLRAIEAWRSALSSGSRPIVAAGGILAAILVVLLVGDYLAFVVDPVDRPLVLFERVKWPFEILLLVPIFYVAFRVIAWPRIGAWGRSLAGALVATLALIAMVTSQHLVLQGRVLVGVSEREFVLAEIRRQVGLGKSAREIAAIVLSTNPYPSPSQLTVELFTLTSYYANVNSLAGMVRVITREMGLENRKVEFAYDNDVYRLTVLEELARVRNLILVDFRQFPGPMTARQPQIEKDVQIWRRISCHSTIDPTMLDTGENLPLMTVGDSGRADIFYARRQGDNVVIGIDNWGVSQTETAIERTEIEKKRIEMTIDYSDDVAKVTIGGIEVLRDEGHLSSWLSSRRFSLGANQLKYPGFAASTPEIARQREAGEAGCETHNHPLPAAVR